MAPSITEALFALGLGDRVVGVTRYCDHPPEAGRRPKIGGLMDPDDEVIVGLEPDLVVVLTSHGDIAARLEQLGLNTLAVPHETVQDVRAAIRAVGDACAVSERVEAILSDMTRRVDRVRSATSGLDRPSVLFCLGRGVGDRGIGRIYVAGRGGFYDEILEMAGAVNAVPESMAAYPQLSLESLLRLDPDIVLDLIGMPDNVDKESLRILDTWRRVPNLKAVAGERVYVITGNHALRPGPRFVDLLEGAARVIHPEVAWDSE